MPAFHYTILKNGIRKSGRLTAANSGEAAQQLRSDSAIVLNIREKSTFGAGENAFFRQLARYFVSSAELELSFRQLSSILAGDVPILLGITTVGQQCSLVLRLAYARIHDRVREGCALSVALQEHAPFIDRVSIGLVQVGECNGTLDRMFAYASELMETARRLRGDLLQAFSYPVFVVLAGMGVAWFMATRVIPKVMAFIQSRQGKSGRLPPITQALLDVTSFIQSYGLYILAIPVLLTIVFMLADVNAPAAKLSMLGYCIFLCLAVHSVLMPIPCGAEPWELYWAAVSVLYRHWNWWKTPWVTGFMRRSSGSCVNRCAKDVQCRQLLNSTSLARLCPMAKAMIVVGEQSGGIDRALLQVANYYEDLLQRRVKVLSRLVEPVMYAIVGGMVGFVYFAFFLAMMAAQRASI